MIRRIIRYIKKKSGITGILDNQEQVIRKTDFLLMQNTELLKASIFNNSITDCEWLKYKSFSPGGWAVDYAFLYTLFRVLLGMQPKSIIEFGLGQSSKLIHQYANFHPNVNAITYEHDPEWIDFFQKSTDGDYKFNIKEIELARIEYNGSETLSYKDIDKECKGKTFDLIVIDAPFGSERYSRSQVLELAKNNLADNFCIIIDDYNRKGEKETVRELKDLLDKKNTMYVSAVYEGSKQHIVLCSKKLKFLTTM